MGVEYRLYSFPLNGLRGLLAGGNQNAEKIIRLLFRNTIKDKEVLSFLSSELQKQLKRGTVTLERLKNLATGLLTPLFKYQNNTRRYELWFKSKERKEYLENRHRRNALYVEAPAGLAEQLQQRVDKAKKGDKEGLFTVLHITTKIDGEEKEVGFEYYYGNDRVTDLKLFYSRKDQQLYENLGKWERMEKEWQEYKLWFQDRGKWLEEHGLGTGELKLAEKIARHFNSKELIGSFINSVDFFQSESPEIHEFLKMLKSAEDPLMAQLEEIEKQRAKHGYKSKEYEELKHKKNELLKERFSLSVFDQDETLTLHVFDMAKVDRKELLRATAKFSGKIKTVVRNVVDRGENAIMYEVI